MSDISAMPPALNSAQPGHAITKAEHVLEGTTNLLEAGMQLQLLASYWLRLHELGWTLDGPVIGQWALLVAPEGWTQ